MDDGAPDLDTSLEMGRIAETDGIGTIVATPHIVEGYYDGSDLGKRLGDLSAKFSESGIELRLVCGAEVPMSACLNGDGSFLKPLTISGRGYLLMETADTTFEQLARAVYSVRLCGLKPILAHPERASFVQHEPARLTELIDRDDVYCQVTAGSLEGVFGKAMRKTGIALAKAGMIHLVASDGHSTGRRSPRISACYRILSQEVGETAARRIMVENPSLVLAGERLAGLERKTTSSRHSLFARLIHRS